MLAAVLLLIGGSGAGLYLFRNQVLDEVHFWLARSSGGDLAAVPQPRKAANGAAPEPVNLNEMPALVATDAAKPENWPDLGPADLLAQSAALGDRALKDTAFDQPPSRRFARPFNAPEGRPVLGLLLTGLGPDRGVTAAAIAGLPAEVSLSFDPTAADLADWIAASRAFGHEALVELPLQSKEKRDLGSYGLFIGMNADEAERRIDALADAAPKVVGIVSQGGDAFLLDDTATGGLARDLARLGLAFIDVSGEPMSQAGSAARQAGLAVARGPVILDERPSRTAIMERLAAATEVAQEQGRAFAVARATSATITTLADWLRRQDEQAPLPAPASALLQRE